MTRTAESVAAYYWALFFTTPRHAVWNGQHWHPQPAGLPSQTIVSALAGDGPPLSAFFLSDEATTHVGAIDVDDVDGWEAVEKITRALVEANVTAYPEHSRRGGHLWVVADRRVPAIVMRYGLMAAVEEAGLDPADKRLELRPSTHRRTSEYAGGSLRGPWMAHPVSGERYGLLAARTMRPLHARIAGALLEFEQADHQALIALAERYVPRGSPQGRSTNMDKRREPASVTAALERGWGILTAPGRSLRCPLHEDAHPSLKVAADDQRAWCWSPGCVLHEGGRGVTAWRLDQLAGAA